MLILVQCDNEELEVTNVPEKSFRSVSVDRAKMIFSHLNTNKRVDSTRFLAKSSNRLYENPNWQNYATENLDFTNADLGTVSVSLNVKNSFKSRLIFLEDQDGVYAAIEATTNVKKDASGRVWERQIFYFDFDGNFLDGYVTKDRRVTNRLIPSNKPAEAGTMALFNAIFFTGDECDALVLEYNNQFCVFGLEVDVTFDVMTIVAYRDPDPVQYYVSYNSPMKELDDGGFGGGFSGDADDDSEEGKCPEGMIEDATGTCVKKRDDDCPDKMDRKNDSNKGFFTETQIKEDEEIKVKKATFSIKKEGDIDQSDLESIAGKVEDIYLDGEMPMDLELNINDENANEAELQIILVERKAIEITLPDGSKQIRYSGGRFKPTDGIIQLAHRVRVQDIQGNLIRYIKKSRSSMARTLAHEIGHSFGLQHVWIDYPAIDNQAERVNKRNLMNSDQNPKEKYRSHSGKNISSDQKTKIEHNLKSKNRDGKNC